MKLIPLSNGGVVKVSDEDYPHLVTRSWYANKIGNKVYAVWWNKKTQRPVSMHREIMDFPKSSIDHIDGDGLNNCRENLRSASASLNALNASFGKGVCKIRGRNLRKPYRSIIMYNGKATTLGYYATYEEANEAYEVMKLMLLKEIA